MGPVGITTGDSRLHAEFWLYSQSSARSNIAPRAMGTILGRRRDVNTYFLSIEHDFLKREGSPVRMYQQSTSTRPES